MVKTFAAKVVLDSISPMGVRLTTMELTFPRFILAEFNTHRVFSRNSASSRARPVEKVIQEVKDNPYIPIHWGKNQKGMSAYEELDEKQILAAKPVWEAALQQSLWSAEALMHIGVHKQIANRLLEPFMWHTVIVSSTTWTNFLAQRKHKDAQPEIQRVAELVEKCLKESDPGFLYPGEWHMPYIYDEDVREVSKGSGALPKLKSISTARCARVSYLTHDGVRSHELDLELFDKLSLADPMHLSPFEHVATPSDDVRYYGNFKGWRQFRKEIEMGTVNV